MQKQRPIQPRSGAKSVALDTRQEMARFRLLVKLQLLAVGLAATLAVILQLLMGR